MPTQNLQAENYHLVASLFLSATSPTVGDHEADGAFRALRRKCVGGAVDPHAVADRIRGGKSFAPDRDAPAFLAMSLGVRRVWLDAIALRLRLSSWERKFVVDVRGRALSSTARLSEAQMRALQGLVDRAWSLGVRP